MYLTHCYNIIKSGEVIMGANFKTLIGSSANRPT